MINNSNNVFKQGFALIPMLFLGLVLTVGLSGCRFFDNNNEDKKPTVSLSAASIEEGNSGSVNLDFTVSSSAAINQAITLTYSTLDGTATAGSDYTETSGTVDIDAGSTSATISVPVLGDTDIEADETFTLTLTAASAATLGTSSVTGTITNDDADPKGYYDSGMATVKQDDDITDLVISDLQGMVSGNRFMLMSVSEALLYDGSMVITGSSYTANVNIYKSGTLVSDSATISGSITTASSMTGTLTGVGAGNGSFSLTYSLNNSPAELSRIDVVDGWRGPLNGASSDVFITFISSVGEISRDSRFTLNTPAIAECVYDVGSTVLPISGINVYDVSITLTNCVDPTVDGDYTGFATTQSVTDDVLLLAFSNGATSGSGILPLD